MSAQLFFLPFNTLYTSRGLPAGGGKVYFYYTGTTTLAPVYSDAGLTTRLDNPVPTDGLGVLPAIYLDGTIIYRVAPQDINGVQLGPPIDNYVPGVSADTAAAASAGAAAVSASAAAASAASVSGQAAAAAASAATASAAATTATAASLSAGDYYVNAAASNVPRGLTQASVGAITPGSGGTNGTFALAWSGGNFAPNPTGTFTVAGGALTAVTITGPGLYIGASPTVPTPSFAASSGLTGAAVALTVQFLVLNGQIYWVQSSDNTKLLAYQNVGGVATAVTGLGPIPLDVVAQSAAAGASATAAAASASAASSSAASAAVNAAAATTGQYAAAVKSAAGNGTIRALFDMDGPRTAYSGSPTILTALQSLDDTPLTLSVYSTLFSGADPRPYYDPRGIYFGSAAGLNTTSPIFTKTSGDFAFLYAVDLNTLTSTVSLQSSLPASNAEGDMVLVNGDRNLASGLGADIDSSLMLNAGWADSDLVNGYNVWSSWTSSWAKSFFLLKATGSGGSRFEIKITHLGQLSIFMYDGTNQALLLSTGNVVIGNSKLVFGIRRKGNTLRLIINGQEVQAFAGAALPNITDLNSWNFNGSGRQAAAVAPVLNGVRHYWKGMAVGDDLSESEFRNVHDEFARRHKSPRLAQPRQARGVVVYGQSWTQGGTDTSTDTWRHGPNNWDGKIASANGSFAQESNSITREAFPNWFIPQSQDVPWDIGPYQIATDRSGSQSNATSHCEGSTGENFLPGFFKQMNTRVEARQCDWIVSGDGQGGASIALLSQQATACIVQQLKTAPLTVGNDYYNKLIRQIIYAHDFAMSKGQTYSVDLFVWQQGHTDLSNAAYLTALFALYDKLCADISSITGQSHKPVMISPQINWSYDGTQNTCNCDHATGGSNPAGVIDQLFLDMEDTRGTRPLYCVGPMYPITSFIHPYRAAHRWIGELFGQAACRILFDGESYGCLRPYAYTYSIGGTTIDIDYRVRSGRALTLNCTNDNNVYTTVANQGFEFVDASAGGVTISGVAATSSTRIRITLSGAIGAGDIIRYTGNTLRVGNVADGAKVNGLYKDQDWTVPFVSNEPTFALGNLTDLRQWAVASKKTL
jgi:hypothetical protein